jgi:hypothetical protein
MNEELFSDFIENIDAVDSHTCIYPKIKYSEADVIRLPFDLKWISVINGSIVLYYENGVYAEIARK